MNRFLGAVLGLVVYSLPGVASHADDKDKDAQTVIDKAVKAMGGAEKLARAEMVTYKSRSKMFLRGGNVREATTQATEASGGRMRLELDREEGNVEILRTLTVLNGDKAWRKDGETIQELNPEAVLVMKRNRETLDVVRRPDILKEPRFLVKMVGEQRVGDRPAVVLQVTGTLGQDFKLSFDKENGLPIRFEAKMTTPNIDRGFDVVMTLSHYKEFDGIRVATKREQTHDGVKANESEIIEFKVLEKISQGTFDEPT